MEVIQFLSTEAAYFALEYGMATPGDILVVEREQVVGVASPFNFAVTVKRGELLEFLVDQPLYVKAFVALVQSIYAAVDEAKRRGYEVIPELDNLCSQRPNSRST